MTARRPALALLLLLAILQGIAPLLHAHVGARPAGAGVHAPLHLPAAGVLLPDGHHAGPDERLAVGLGSVIERRERLDLPSVLPLPAPAGVAPPSTSAVLVVPAARPLPAAPAVERVLPPPAHAPPRAFA